MSKVTKQLEPGLEIQPDAKIDILALRPDVVVSVRCRCAGAEPFLLALNQGEACPACGVRYRVKAFRFVPRPDGTADIGVAVGPVHESPIVSPHAMGRRQ